MPRPPKFNFTPVVNQTHCAKTNKAFVTICKTGNIIFNRACIEQYGLANKYIRFYTDADKKVLGWQIITTVNDFKEIKDKKYRQIKTNAWHTSTLSILSILQQIGIVDKAFYKLDIYEYLDTIYNKIYYVTLKYESNKRD